MSANRFTGTGRVTRRRALGMAAGRVAGRGVPAGTLAQSADRPPERPRGQVVAGLSQEPTVMHPLMSGIEVDQGVWWNLYSPLWYLDPQGNYVPDLAREIPSQEN